MKRITLVVTLLLVVIIVYPAKAKASYPIYTVSPTSANYNKSMMNYSTYNKYTKHYYLLRSYLEQLEKKGGGTLILKKGVYTITNTLYVPSNVTIKMSDGVQVIKGTVTGTTKFHAAKSMFQLIRPSRSAKTGIYSGYNGEKNISFVGEGNVIIDMKYDKDSIAIIAGHNQNITVQNIKFKNMYSGHFLEVDATKNIKIKNNQFLYSKASENKNKEAINLDTPDHATNGWSQNWSKYDKTPNYMVLIENNKFYNLDRAVGTHKYSQGKYHTAVTIRGNQIENMRNDAIRVMNWSNALIEKNTITNVASGQGIYRGILASGALNPTFRYNTFDKVSRSIHFIPWKNTGPGSTYATIYNKLTSTNKQVLATNKVNHVTENFIRIFNGQTTEKISLQN